MPKTVRKKPIKRKIRISQEHYDRILMWSQSQKEILFFCLGQRNSVENVIRLCNVSKNPKNSAVWSEKCYKTLIEPHKKSLKIIAEGHSHPSKHHDRYPSKVDIENAIPGDIELIAFPSENLIRGWIIGRTKKQTLINEIEIICR